MTEFDFLSKKYNYTLSSIKDRFRPSSVFYGRNDDSRLLDNIMMDNIIPAYPLEKSLVRPNGLMLWDLIMTTTSRVDESSAEIPAGPLKPKELWNSFWQDKDLSSARQSYSYFTKDQIDIPYHIDLSKNVDGFEMYKAIHTLSHAWADPIAIIQMTKNRKYVYQRWLPLAAANSSVSVLYDKGIYTEDGEIIKFWSVPVVNGLRIYSSTSINSSKFFVPIGDLTATSNIDNMIGCVFVYVYIQAPPTMFEDPLDVHKFSGGPVRMLVAGWETIDFLLNCPLSFHNGRRCVVVDVLDLFPPKTLEFYYRQRSLLGYPDGGTRFLRWMSADAGIKELRCPSVPDRQCAIFLPEFEDRPIPSKNVLLNARYKRRTKDLFDKVKSVVIDYERSIRATDEEKKDLRHHRAQCNKGYISKMKQLKLRKKRIQS